MIRSTLTRLDGCMLVVRIPMRFQRRGGRKRIVAPDGSEPTAATKPQPDGTLVKALARAWRWQRMLETANTRLWPSWLTPSASAAVMSAACCDSPSSRPTSSNASWTAGRCQSLPQLLEPFPVEWETQRQRLL